MFGGVQVVAAAADPGLVRVRAGGLGGQHDLVALAGFLEPAADEALGRALRAGAGRHRVHLGGVDEVDAALERVVELAVRVGFGVLLAEGHGAEADAGDVQAGAAELVYFHECYPCCGRVSASAHFAHQRRPAVDQAAVQLHQLGAGVDLGLGVAAAQDAAHADDGHGVADFLLQRADHDVRQVEHRRAGQAALLAARGAGLRRRGG